MTRMQWNKKIVIVLLVLSLIMSYMPWSVMKVQASELYVDRQADIVFVIDATGSMGSYINSVKAHIEDFLNLLSGEKVDIRTRFVVYMDITNKEGTVASEWFSDTASALEYLKAITLGWGNDELETLLDGYGMMLADDFGFRDDAHKFCMALTDAGTKTDNNYGYASEADVIAAIQKKGINSSMITRTSLFGSYGAYVTAGSEDGTNAGGILGDIDGDYSILLKELANTILNVIKLSEMSPVKGPVGQPTEVTVKATDLVYADDFQVLMGDQPVTVTEKADKYFKFIVPTDLPIGAYEVKVVNASSNLEAGTFKIYGPDQLTVTQIEPTSGVEKTTTEVTVTATGIDYKDNFKVYVGDVISKVTYTKANFFVFNTPNCLSAGTYDIKVYDDTYGKRTIGSFTFTREIPELDSLSISDISPISGEEKSAINVQVIGKGMNYSDGFEVYVGDQKATLVVTKSKYFTFDTPDTLTAGTYDIKVKDNTYGERKIGSFTFTGKTPEPDSLAITDISPTSGEEKSVTNVQVIGKGMNYSDGFEVYVGDQKATLVVTKSRYFPFDTPDTLAAGTYDIKVSDNTYGLRTIGNFTVVTKTS